MSLEEKIRKILKTKYGIETDEEHLQRRKTACTGRKKQEDQTVCHEFYRRKERPTSDCGVGEDNVREKRFRKV